MDILKLALCWNELTYKDQVLFKLEKTATEKSNTLGQVHENDAKSKKFGYGWFEKVREGMETVDEKPRSSRSSTTTNNIE